MGFISGVVSHIVDAKLEQGLSKAAKKATKKGDVLEAKAIMFILEGSQRAKQEEKAKKTEAKAQKIAKKAETKATKEKARIQRTSEWGEEMKEAKSPSQASAGSTPSITSTSSKFTLDQSALQGILGKIEKVREEVEKKVEQAVREGKFPEQDYKLLIGQIANKVYLQASDEKRKARSSSLDTNRITQLISGEVEKVVSARQAKIEREGAIKEVAERKVEQERQKELKKEQRQADFDGRTQEASESFESRFPRDTRFPFYESAEAASQAQEGRRQVFKASCQEMKLPSMPDVTSASKFEPQTSIWKDRKVEVLPSNDLDAIAEHVKAYNIATVLAVVFIGLTILLGIPFGFIPLFIALEMLAKRSEEREAVEQIENNHSAKNWGKSYYKDLEKEHKAYADLRKQETKEVKKPEFHWWGATHLQFV